MNFYFFLKISVFCCLQLTVVRAAHSESQEQAQAAPKLKPLSLQWEVSHSRNRDHISLTFETETVELIVNTDSYQKKGQPHLGRFKSPLTGKLKRWKGSIQWIYTRLRETVSMASLIKDPRFKQEVEMDPHAPVLRVNEEEIRSGNSYFGPLEKIIHEVWEESEWVCMECASYKRKKNRIERSIKKAVTNFEGTAAKLKKPRYKTDKKTFSKKELNCISKGKRKMECVDPRFGVFEL